MPTNDTEDIKREIRKLESRIETLKLSLPDDLKIGDRVFIFLGRDKTKGRVRRITAKRIHIKVEGKRVLLQRHKKNVKKIT